MATSVTFTFGPPSTPEARETLTLAEEAGLNPDWTWIFRVRLQLAELAEPGEEGTSSLDGLVSEALGEPVVVTAHESSWCINTRPLPTLELVTTNVRSAATATPALQLAQRKAQEKLAALLQRAFETEWMHVMAFETPQEASCLMPVKEPTHERGTP